MNWLLLWCHRHTEIAGFAGAIVLDGTVVVLLLNARRIGRCAARLGRFVARVYVNDPPARTIQPVTPESLRMQARRQWMDDHAQMLVDTADWHALEYMATHGEEAQR